MCFFFIIEMITRVIDKKDPDSGVGVEQKKNSLIPVIMVCTKVA